MALNQRDIIQDNYNYSDPHNFKYGYFESVMTGSRYHKEQGGSCPNVDKSMQVADVFESEYKCGPYTYYKNLIKRRNESCACTLAREVARSMMGKDKAHDLPYYLSNLYCGQCEREILRLSENLQDLKSAIFNFRYTFFGDLQIGTEKDLTTWIRKNPKNAETFYSQWSDLIDNFIVEDNLQLDIKDSIHLPQPDGSTAISLKQSIDFIDDILNNLHPMDKDKLNLIDIHIRNYVKRNWNNRRDRFVEIYKKFYDITKS